MTVTKLLPGIALCAVVALTAAALESVQQLVLRRAWIESIVLAIVVGTLVRGAWVPGPRWTPGIDASAKQLLETAVVLLGASIDVPLLVRAGLPLAGGIAAVVAIAIGASYALSRSLGLSRHLALLVACGNSICGNSAIAAAAPVIGADADDVASAIAFTAVLGVAVVLMLPLLGHALGYTAFQFGVLAGLSVYAVPQVLAVTLAFDPLSSQVGTLVKLVRVLMLGPVVVTLAVLRRRVHQARARAAEPHVDSPALPRLGLLVPWFVVGFVLLAALRATGAIGPSEVLVLRQVARLLTVLAMAALGLGVDAQSLSRGGLAVTSAVLLSLLVLVVISVSLIAALRLT